MKSSENWIGTYDVALPLGGQPLQLRISPGEHMEAQG